ncbi:uncharacterized protein BXZ73DRAFT_106795 [Epithele typhae]|uniref:uncharacterized protein n=1 Tax=Epithele typhae TaxID=378194 RepID=UPI0020089546|nr:uncharacterized protein BXZ73DRAFT_106795 [Epithele typhae]KAH9913893.1 hypothetical protein BXZ73DRAFT_106795 [Epithele typhae]
MRANPKGPIPASCHHDVSRFTSSEVHTPPPPHRSDGSFVARATLEPVWGCLQLSAFATVLPQGIKLAVTSTTTGGGDDIVLRGVVSGRARK